MSGFIVKVSTLLKWPIQRQIIQNSGYKFVINQLCDRCDAWIVYQGLFRPETTTCPVENVILFTYEPPGLHTYHPKFLKQFSKVVTCHPSIQHPGVIYRHQAQPWLAGLRRHSQENIHSSHEVKLIWDDFAAMPPLPKPKLVSVLCSNKVMTPGHQQRLAFVDYLRTELGDIIDIFGYGFQPLEDKWDALAPYKYHIVLENTVIDDYWTEKLADAYLGYCFPIVSGCPNLSKYFLPTAYLSIDLQSQELALAQIRSLIQQDNYLEKLNSIQEARKLILYEYNLFSEILKLINPNPKTSPQKIHLKDERLFLPGGWIKPLLRPLKDSIKPKTNKE